jgi:hypothetical protein
MNSKFNRSAASNNSGGDSHRMRRLATDVQANQNKGKSMKTPRRTNLLTERALAAGEVLCESAEASATANAGNFMASAPASRIEAAV